MRARKLSAAGFSARMTSGPVRLIAPASSSAPGPAGSGTRFAGDDGTDRCRELPEIDDGIDRHALAGPQFEPHARRDFVERDVLAAAVVDDAHGAARRQPGEVGDGAARLLAHQVVERAADQQEEQQRDRGVEIGLRAGLSVSNRLSRRRG